LATRAEAERRHLLVHLSDELAEHAVLNIDSLAVESNAADPCLVHFAVGNPLPSHVLPPREITSRI
jgi:hypothetical protein